MHVTYVRVEIKEIGREREQAKQLNRLVLRWDYGGQRHLVDTAGTIATINPVVALFSPVLAPAVLHDPVGHRLATETSFVHAKSNEKNPMIQVRRTAEELPWV